MDGDIAAFLLKDKNFTASRHLDIKMMRLELDNGTSFELPAEYVLMLVDRGELVVQTTKGRKK